MKKVFLFAFGFLLFTSCKKDFTCVCTDKVNYSGMVSTSEYSVSIEEASKKRAKYACNEATIKSKSGDYSVETTCELKK